MTDETWKMFNFNDFIFLETIFNFSNFKLKN